MYGYCKATVRQYLIIMVLNSVRIRDFRNIGSADIEFSDGVNIIRGDNAQGKTNILEAIYIFARGRSHRTKKESELIRFGCGSSSAEIAFTDSQRTKTLCVKYAEGKSRKLFYNGVKLSRASEFIGNFRAVLFCPDHLSLIKDAAVGRRLFLDVAISQLTPSYLTLLKSYNALLQQRNALLKQPDAESQKYRLLFETLAEQLSQTAAGIARYRYKYVERLSRGVDAYFEEMTDGREKVSIEYEASGVREAEKLKSIAELKETYYSLFTEHIPREAYQRVTAYGTHKDDMDIRLNERSSRLFCSQGQQRSLALALKLTEGDLSMEISGEYPVYLLDDILGELDATRRNYILSRLTGKQIILTTCTGELNETVKADNVITVRGGEIVTP